MIDYSNLANDTINTLQPFLELGGKEILKSVAKDAWIKIKNSFSKPLETKVIEILELEPTNQNNIGKFELLLEQKFSVDKEFYHSILDSIKKIKSTEDYSSIIKQLGNDNISISGKIDNSKINIKK